MSIARPRSSKPHFARRPAQRTQQAAARRREARRLLLETLEDRSLMAFNILSEQVLAFSPQNVALTQIGGSSQPDLVATEATDGDSLQVALGAAGGTFGAPQAADAGDYPRSLATGDFNNDTFPDVVAANSTDLVLLLGNGDGTFQPPQSIPLPPQDSLQDPAQTNLPQHPLSVATGDLNKDGKLDLAVGADTYFSQLSCYYYYGSYYCNNTYFYDNHVNVLLGNGTGGFTTTETKYLGSDRFPNSIAMGDLNGDTNPDVVAADGYGLSALLGNGTGAVADPVFSGSGWSFTSLSLGDVDGDGKLDTVLGSYGGLSVQKGLGTGQFAAQSPLALPFWASSAVIGKVNSGDELDLVAVGSNSTYTGSGYTHTREAAVLIGDGHGAFAAPLVSSFGSASDYGWLPAVALADLTGDGKPELAVADYYAKSVIIAANDGEWHPLPTISITDVSVSEGNSGTVNAVFTVSLVGEHGNVSVNYATGGGSAAAGTDYTATSGTLNFSGSDSSLTITVPVKGDTLHELDEQFFVNLSGAVNGIITDSQAVGTIQDDDPAPNVSINDVSKNEGNRNNTSFTFTVSIQAPSGTPVTVSYATANDTATTGDNDYVAKIGSVTIPTGQTSVTVTILVRGDKRKEADETFFVNLTGASGGTISDGRGVGTIVNDDGGNGKGKPFSSSLFAAPSEDDVPTTRKKK